MTRSRRLVLTLTLPALAAVVTLSACEASSPSPNLSPSPTMSVSPSAPSSAAFSPNPTTTLDPAPEPTVSLLAPSGYGEDMTFDFDDFNGFPVGTTEGEFSDGTGFDWNVCSGPGLTTWLPTDGLAGWWLVGPSYFSDETTDSVPAGKGSAPNWSIDWFSLEAFNWSFTIEEPFGPIGPNELRLGWTEQQVLDAFPDATLFLYIDDRYDVVTTIIEYIIPAPDGTAMVVALEDGHVNRIAWGSPTFTNGFSFVLCA